MRTFHLCEQHGEVEAGGQRCSDNGGSTVLQYTYIHYIHTYKYIMQDNLTQFYTNLHYNVILHLFAK